MDVTTMDVTMISNNLLWAYGIASLCLGAVVGVVIGRALRPKPESPTPDTPEWLQRRVELLELSSEYTNATLERLLDREEQSRKLRIPESRRSAA